MSTCESVDRVVLDYDGMVPRSAVNVITWYLALSSKAYCTEEYGIHISTVDFSQCRRQFIYSTGFIFCTKSYDHIGAQGRSQRGPWVDFLRKKTGFVGTVLSARSVV